MWVFVFKKVSKHKSNLKNTEKAVTIMVCAKDEEVNLQKNIPFWLAQKHKHMETLIVDDFSGIKTFHLIDKLRQKERYLHYYKVKLNIVGKKQAILEGLSKSSHKWVLLTDADCFPASKLWLKTMIETAESSQKEIILGYSPYKINKKGLLQLWIHFEGWITGISYLSFAAIGIPYMGVGRNLLYKKSLITQNAMSKHLDIASGDDDLLINTISNKDNTDICIHPNSFVYTQPADSWNNYYRQKTRHYSTSKRYKLLHKILLSAYSFSQIAFFSLLIILLCKRFYLLCLCIYLFRIILILPVANALKDKLDAKFKLFQFLLLDFLQAIYYIIFSFAVIFPKKNNW